MKTKIFEKTVTDILWIFRESLIALIPSMEKAKIGWRDNEAYDDWDEIAKVLYEKIIVRSIQFSLGVDNSVDLPSYGIRYDSYKGRSFIICETEQSAIDENFFNIFLGFSTETNFFDQVNVAESKPDNLNLNKVKSIKITDVKNFCLMVNKTNTDECLRISSLKIDL